MINRLIAKASSAGFFPALLFILGLQSGATVRCGAAGIGIMAGVADSLVEDCIKSYEGRGYVSVEKLTPEQRTDLERRGVLSKPEKPSPRMGY